MQKFFVRKLRILYGLDDRCRNVAHEILQLGAGVRQVIAARTVKNGHVYVCTMTYFGASISRQSYRVRAKTFMCVTISRLDAVQRTFSLADPDGVERRDACPGDGSGTK